MWAYARCVTTDRTINPRNRLFVALELPEQLRAHAAEAAAVATAHTQARLVATANLHITLQFLGQVRPECADDLLVALADALHGPVVRVRAGAVVARPSSGRARLLALELDDVDGALTVLAHRVHRATVAALGLADLDIAMGAYDRAEKVLTQLLERSGEDTSANARLGILHSRRGRPDLALPELKSVVDKDPSQLEAKAELGFLYLRGGNADAALKVLNAVLAADPRNALAALYRGHALFAKGDPQKAEESFQTSSRFDPAFGEPHYALGQLYEAGHKNQDALREYKLAATLQKDHPDAAAAAKRLAQMAPSAPLE